MTYFTGEATTQQQATPAPDQEDSDKDYLEELVQSKGENWKDPKEIAKGYIHSQRHIQQLEEELKAIREQAKQTDYMKEVLDRLDQKISPPSSEDKSGQKDTGGTNEDGTPAVNDVEKIKELVLSTLTEQEQKNTAAQNLQETDRKLTELFGTEAAKHVERRRAELGMSKDMLEGIAAESPSAFLSLMGAPKQKETNQNPGTPSMRTEGNLTQTNERNWAYYQKLRKENPKLYRSPRIQNQMLADKLRLGDAFGN